MPRCWSSAPAGDRVVFDPPGRRTQRGTVTRYDRKTASLVTEVAERRPVAPSLLRRDADPPSRRPFAGRIIDVEPER